MNLVTNITLLTKKDQKHFPISGDEPVLYLHTVSYLLDTLPAACHKNIIYLISLVELTEIAKYSTFYINKVIPKQPLAENLAHLAVPVGVASFGLHHCNATKKNLDIHSSLFSAMFVFMSARKELKNAACKW